MNMTQFNIQGASQFHWSQLIQNSNITGCARSIWVTNEMNESQLFGQLDPHQKKATLKFENPTRRHQWILARVCENQLKKEFLSQEPCLTSVSHSENALLAVGLLLESNSLCISKTLDSVLGIGVDLEKFNRTLSPAVQDRVISVRERALKTSLSALEFWVIKEACYKANPLNQGTTISQYQLLAFDSADCEGEVGYFQNGIESPKKDITFRYRIFSQDQWVVAFAVALCCCNQK